jgi:hypothetical protein
VPSFGAQSVIRDIVEKAYHRRDEVTSGATARSSSAAGGMADDGLTATCTDGDTTLLDDEGRPSALEVRRISSPHRRSVAGLFGVPPLFIERRAVAL